MGFLEEQNVKTSKYASLVTQWMLALVAYASLSMVANYDAHMPLNFAMGMLVAYWILLMPVLYLIGTGRAPVYLQPAILEVFFGVVINVLLFAAFCALSANTLGNVHAKVATGFSFFLWVGNLFSTYLTVDTWNKGGEEDESDPTHGLQPM